MTSLGEARQQQRLRATACARCMRASCPAECSRAPFAASYPPPPPARIHTTTLSAIIVISGTIIALSLAFSLVNAIDKIPIGEPRLRLLSCQQLPFSAISTPALLCKYAHTSQTL